MRQHGLSGRCRRRFQRTAIPDPQAGTAAVDLLQRHFAAAALELNQAWCGDISYVRTREGWLYLATVIDLASRRVVGWAMADHMRTTLVGDALRMAVESRRPPPGLIFHTDRGSQYTARDFTALLADHAIRQSLSRPRQCWDNAVAESWFATLKNELIYRRSWPTRAEARRAIFEFSEVFYNRRRRRGQVEDRGARVALEIARDQLLRLDVEDALQRAGGGGLESLVDRAHRGRLREVGDEVDDGDDGRRHAVGDAVQLALELRDHLRDGARRARRGRDDVERGGAGAPQVLVLRVDEVLVARVGVDRGHQRALDAELIVQHLDHGHDAVGGAGAGRDHVVAGRVVLLVVDAEDDHPILALAGCGDDHLLHAVAEVPRGAVAVAEGAGRLDDDLDAERAPVDGRGVGVLEDAHRVAIDGEGVLAVGDLGREAAVVGVVAQQVGVHLDGRAAVDGDDLEVIAAALPPGAHELAPGAPEAVDPDAHTVDADIVLLDEFDRMDPETLALAQQRIASSRLGWLRAASTPSAPETGINRLFLESDQRHYLLPCPGCGLEQALTLDNLDAERVLLACSSCGSELDLWAEGRWEAAAPSNGAVHGYHLPRLYSP